MQQRCTSGHSASTSLTDVLTATSPQLYPGSENKACTDDVFSRSQGPTEGPRIHKLKSSSCSNLLDSGSVGSCTAHLHKDVPAVRHVSSSPDFTNTVNISSPLSPLSTATNEKSTENTKSVSPSLKISTCTPNSSPHVKVTTQTSLHAAPLAPTSSPLTLNASPHSGAASIEIPSVIPDKETASVPLTSNTSPILTDKEIMAPHPTSNTSPDSEATSLGVDPDEKTTSPPRTATIFPTPSDNETITSLTSIIPTHKEAISPPLTPNTANLAVDVQELLDSLNTPLQPIGNLVRVPTLSRYNRYYRHSYKRGSHKQKDVAENGDDSVLQKHLVCVFVDYSVG